MDGVTQAQAASLNAVNQILMKSNQAAMNQAEKLMKLAVEMTVGMETGKGKYIDMLA